MHGALGGELEGILARVYGVILTVQKPELDAGNLMTCERTFVTRLEEALARERKMDECVMVTISGQSAASAPTDLLDAGYELLRYISTRGLVTELLVCASLRRQRLWKNNTDHHGQPHGSITIAVTQIYKCLAGGGVIGNGRIMVVVL